MPARSAVTASVMPSFSRPGGVVPCTRPMPVTMVGAVAIPARSSAPARARRLPVPAATSGPRASTAIVARHRRKRAPAGPAGRHSPYRSPATHDPAACRPSTTPAAARWPWASAKPTVTTSSEPKSAPVQPKTASSSARAALPRSGDRDEDGRGPSGGSVRRCAAKRIVPVRNSAVPTSVPASGKNVVHRKTASTGPSMKQASSAACSKEFAVCRAAGSSRKRCAQRARAMPPVLGVVAVAAYATNSAHAGASHRTHATSASDPDAATTAAGTAIRACPYRSTSRAVHGATTAVVASPVAVTAPASAYDPRAAEIISTAPTPNIPMGSRASRFHTTNARAPGTARIRAYGPGRRRRRAGPGAPARSRATRVAPVTAKRGAEVRRAVVVVAGMPPPSP